jgi:hypothetical protein
MRQENKALFQDYEIKNWDYSPHIYKFLGAAAIFNLLTLLVMGQTDMLTTRGCDSPMVSRVCQVIDTIYVGSTLLGTDSDFESRDYVKSELEDAEITYVNLTGADEPLNYPAGYFALANPNDDFSTMQNLDGGFPITESGIPGIPMNPTIITGGTDLLAQPQVTPTPNNNAVQGNIPTSPFSYGDNPIGINPVPMPSTTTKNRIRQPRRPKVIKGSPSTLPPLNDEATGENKNPKEKKDESKTPPLESEAVTDFKPNKKPLEDFADGILAERSKKDSKLDLTKPFTVKMTGELDKDGKLDSKKSRYVPLKSEEQGDAEMVNVAKDAIEAINNSGLFYYLKTLGIDKVDLTLVQNDKQIFAVIKSVQIDENRAKTISSRFNNLMSVAKLTVKEEELKTLLNSAKVEQQGKNFILNFNLDKPAAQEMINRKLQEAEAKKKEAEKNNQTTNTAQTSNANQTVAK